MLKLKILFITAFCFCICHCAFAQKIDTCVCERPDTAFNNANNFDIVDEMVMTQPEENGKTAQYKTIKVKVMKMFFRDRSVQYPCDCREKAKIYPTKEVIEPAQYITVKKYTAAGKAYTERVMVRPEVKRLVQTYPPQLNRQ